MGMVTIFGEDVFACFLSAILVPANGFELTKNRFSTRKMGVDVEVSTQGDGNVEIYSFRLITCPIYLSFVCLIA